MVSGIPLSIGDGAAPTDALFDRRDRRRRSAAKDRKSLSRDPVSGSLPELCERRPDGLETGAAGPGTDRQACSMDSADPLVSIAGMLISLPDEAIEDLLVTFDALVDVAGPERRAEAAALLRDKAASCVDPARQARLGTAAEAVAAGRPCALTASGRTWREEAAAPAPMPEVVWSEAPAPAPAEEEPPVILDQPPPRLPRLKLRHFFPGLVVRLRRPVVDTDGREAPAGQRLELRQITITGEEGAASYRLDFAERSFVLDGRPQDDRSIIGNGGNGWFQPVPEREALRYLWGLLEERLVEAEREIEDAEDLDLFGGDLLAALRRDLDACVAWLDGDRDARLPEDLTTAPLAAELFGKGSDMAAWFALFFAALPHCPPW